jgi:hypothetical protein
LTLESAVAADLFSAQFNSDTEQRNRLGEVPLSKATCCTGSWNYTIHVSFDDSSGKVKQSTLFVCLVFGIPMILVLAYKFLQLTKTITWDDEVCCISTDMEEGSLKGAGVTSQDVFVAQPTGVVTEGKTVEVEMKNQVLSPRSRKLKRMPTLFAIAQNDNEDDALKKYEQHRHAEKTKVCLVFDFLMCLRFFQFYWIAAVVGISMMVPAWAYALTLLLRDKSEQNVCHFNNACRADLNFAGLVVIPQFGSSKFFAFLQKP